jgi:hypothetical protein
MKSLILSNDEIFSRKDLLQCLACFDAEDTVFFLISDCETKTQRPKSRAIAESFGTENVKTKAAVLSPRVESTSYETPKYLFRHGGF